MKLPLSAVAAWSDAVAATVDDPAARPDATWQQAVLQTLADRTELDAQDVLLSLGCGTGRLEVALAPHVRTLVAVDCSEGMLAVARKRPGAERVQWERGDLRDPPAVPGLTVVVLAYCVHLLDPDERHRLFALLADRLPLGGRVLVGGYVAAVPPEEVDGIEGWLDTLVDQVPRLQDVVKELEDLGFHVKRDVLHPVLAVVHAEKWPREGGVAEA